MNEQLKQYIEKHITISDQDAETFYSLFEKRAIKKKDFLLRAGETCRFEGFVLQGLFRIYHVDSNGSEQILYFAIEDWWITDIDSFTNQRPSQLQIEALETSEVLLISKENKDLAYKTIPAIERLFRIMTQKTHVALQRRMINSMSKTTTQRYLDFIKEYPAIYQRLTNLQIAAYLGISHEFLSKIRKKILQDG
jgi:CRP-like cAMP-binding protein